MHISNRVSWSNQKLITFKEVPLKFIIILAQRVVHHGRWLEDGDLIQVEDLVFVTILKFLNFTCSITCHKFFWIWDASVSSQLWWLWLGVWPGLLSWPGQESQNYKRWEGIIPEKFQKEKMKTEVKGRSDKLKGKKLTLWLFQVWGEEVVLVSLPSPTILMHS